MFNYRNIAVLLILFCLPIMAFASTSDQLNIAMENGNIAYVIVTEPGVPGVDQAKQMIQSTMSQTPGSVMIESNRADAVNLAFVQKYKLTTVPVPLIIVFASNGAMAGGNIASNLSVQKLMDLIPSPKKAEVLKAIESGQASYITVSRNDMSSIPQVANSCAKACSEMKGKCVAIDISMDDPTEATFLKQLKVNLQATEPVIVVLNAEGQITETFNGPVNITNLVQAATKKVSSGCCPPNSGKTCPPTPTKKKSGK